MFHRYAFLEYSKSRNVLSLHPIPHIYSLSQQVLPEHRKKALNNEAEHTIMEEVDPLNAANYMKIYAELTQSFGSKLRRAQQTRNETYSVNRGYVDKTATHTAITELATDVDPESFGVKKDEKGKLQQRPSESISPYLPKFNFEAKTPHDFYSFDECMLFFFFSFV